MEPLMLTISAGEWEGINHRPHHFMRRSAASGWTVIYLEPPASLIAPLKDKRFLKRWQNWRLGLRQGEAGVYLLAPPPILPFGNRYRWINKMNQRLIAGTVNKALRQFQSPAPDVYTFLPSAVDLLPFIPHQRVIYDCVDDHAAFTGLIDPKVIQEMEQELMAKADVCFATAKQLYEDRKEWSSNFHIIPNGAEYERFAVAATGVNEVADEFEAPGLAGASEVVEAADLGKTAASPDSAETADEFEVSEAPEAPASAKATEALVPEDIADISSPIAGFVGGISDWVDIQLIADTAKLLPDFTFVLIGPVLTDVSCLEAQDNIRMLGPRPYQSLPEYLRFFDVCLITFKINKLTESVNPIKMFEYLSAGKPVVSTPLPEVLVFSQVVDVAANAKDTAEAVRNALSPEAKSVKSRENRQAVARENSWDARWDRALQLIQAVDNSSNSAKPAGN